MSTEDDLVTFILRHAVSLGGMDAAAVARIDAIAREAWGGERHYIPRTIERRRGLPAIPPHVVDQAIREHDTGRPVAEITRKHPISKTSLYAYLAKRAER